MSEDDNTVESALSQLENVTAEINTGEKADAETDAKEQVEAPEITSEGGEAEETQAPAKREFSEIDKKALDLGWRPIDMYYKGDDKWLNSKEFMIREERSGEMKRLRQEKEALEKMLFKDKKKYADNTIEMLEETRQEAILEADMDKVKQVETRIKSVRDEVKEVPAEEKEYGSPQDQASISSFVRRNNEWFNEDSLDNLEMKDWAIKQEQLLANSSTYGHLPLDERFDILEKGVRKRFPARFENKNQKRAAPVESPKGAGTRTVTRSVNPELREILDGFASIMGDEFDENKYLSNLEKRGLI